MLYLPILRELCSSSEQELSESYAETTMLRWSSRFANTSFRFSFHLCSGSVTDEEMCSGKFSTYNPTVFLNGPKFQIDVHRIRGWRVMDAIRDTTSKTIHASVEEGDRE